MPKISRNVIDDSAVVINSGESYFSDEHWENLKEAEKSESKLLTKLKVKTDNRKKSRASQKSSGGKNE